MHREALMSSSYKADLQRTGVALKESLLLLQEFASLGDWQAVRRKAIKENLLQKGSSHTAAYILQAVRRRFSAKVDALPEMPLIAKAVASSMPEVAKEQILYAYIGMTDPLIEACLRHLVGPKLAGLQPSLTQEEVLAFLDAEAETHPELLRWSESLKKRWTRGFLAFLRKFRILEPAPKHGLKRPILAVEAFAFFLFGFLGAGFSGQEALKHDLWDLYFLTDREKQTLLDLAQAKGWLSYQRLADMRELRPQYPSLAEWLIHAMG